MKKTTHEIIDEIAAHYTSNNRSTDGETCLYNGPNDTHCAFAYMLINPTAILPEYNNFTASNLILEVGQDIIKPEYRDHEPSFYNDIQSLHDSRDNWDEEGLSDTGRDRVEQLKKYWPNT